MSVKTDTKVFIYLQTRPLSTVKIKFKMFPNLKNLGKVEFKTKTDTIYKNFGRFDQIFD